ncbi:MAG: hypothetical protein K0V04_08590 [Deltaproteobacteria bacterium]|nr:hypothetical protein [Deltaproteobacteria bacterium]
MRLGLAAIATLLMVGCGASSADFAETDDFIDQDTPPGNCSAGTSSQPCPNPDSTGSPAGGPCFDSDDCSGGNACVAPYEGGEVGDFTCTNQCIELEDEDSWCLDAGACCDANASCRRGLCVAGESADESGTGTASDSSGSGTTGDTDGTTGATTGGSSGSGGSSGTGAATGTTGMR